MELLSRPSMAHRGAIFSLQGDTFCPITIIYSFFEVSRKLLIRKYRSLIYFSLAWMFFAILQIHVKDVCNVECPFWKYTIRVIVNASWRSVKFAITGCLFYFYCRCISRPIEIYNLSLSQVLLLLSFGDSIRWIYTIRYFSTINDELPMANVFRLFKR